MRQISERERCFAVMAGGGTAGHVLPALAIAEALVERGHHRSTIHFLGSRRGQEARLVPVAGFPLTLLTGRGVVRRMTPVALGRNGAAVGGLALALVMAMTILARRRPAVVVSVGGYAALAPALAAVVLRIPLVLANPDAVPNSTNRLVGRFAAASAVAFEGTVLARATVTGTPVRAELASLDRSPGGRRAACKELGLPEDRLTLAVFTGSLGSRRVNEAIMDLVRRWSERGDLTVRHVVGRRDWAELSALAPALPAEGLCYRPVQYEDRMPVLLAAADLLVGRAGASTVAEVALAGVPAVLVPLPNAPGDHQMANAMAMARAGGAIVVPDGECTGSRLSGELGPLLGDPSRRAAMGMAARRLGRPGAANDIATLVEAAASRGRRGRGNGEGTPAHPPAGPEPSTSQEVPRSRRILTLEMGSGA